MKRIVIFWFSGTGNTRYICDRLVEAMESRSWSAASVSIADMSTGERDRLVAEADIVFLAYPIYGSDMPDMMRGFIDDLPEGRGLPLGVVCTQLGFSGDGASILFRRLRRKGYRQMWAWQVNMPNNLCIKGSPFSQSPDYGRHEAKSLAGARAKVERIADAIVSGRKRIGDHTPFHWLLAMTQRPAYRLFAKRYYAGKLDVNADDCIGCERCVTACPAGVLIMKDGKAHFPGHDDCQVCLRCLNFCPASAVTFSGSVKQPLYKGPTPEIYRELF